VVPPSPYPVDGVGHGTHTMGTQVGSAPQEKIGVAPDARWMSCRSLGQNAAISTILACLQFFLAPTDLNGKNPKHSKRPHITSHSYQCTGCNLQSSYTALLKAGIEVVVAAGNNGPNCGTVTEPSSYADTLSVAALDYESDVATFFSGRGPVPNTSFKPNVAAPGVNVISCGQLTGYVSMTGTSMAAPHVAGAIALIWSGRPDLKRNIARTREIFYQTAKKQQDNSCGGTGAAPNFVYGWGTIDVAKAYKQSWRI